MEQPVWQTNAGDLGTYPSYSQINLQLYAYPVFPATIVTYQFLSGELPAGIVITTSGLITGTFPLVNESKTYNFTVRATDEYTNVRDRTFYLNIQEVNNPKFTTQQGSILSVEDSVYIEYQIGYSNPDPTNQVTISLTSGALPPGLSITSNGIITGYPNPPVNEILSPTRKTYTFGLQIQSSLGTDTATYSITVRNQLLSKPKNTRLPVILNSKPLHYPIDKNDIFYDYYVAYNTIRLTRANEFFSYKIIGYDFDGSEVTYNFSELPLGLTGDPVTGWITGTPVISVTSINKFSFTVSLTKTSNSTITSLQETFVITIANGVTEDITWLTNSDLGILKNGETSMFGVAASSSFPLVFALRSGSLPPNLTLLPTGEIVGKVPFQPYTQLINQGDRVTYTFTVRAISPEFSLLQSDKTFTITVLQYFQQPYEDVYLKASPNLPGKYLIQHLLNDENLIPSQYLFRPDDVNFGKAKDVRYVHAYGITPGSLDQYLQAISQNHYNRKLILGPLQTAIARNENNDIIYEVVYSPIIDKLSSSNGELMQTITWPREIPLNLGPYITSTTELYTNSTTTFTNDSPGFVTELHPSSLYNMRTQLISALGQNTDNSLLPLWMTTQQVGSNTLGFVQAWVLCYTLPGYSEAIKQNIEQNWGHTLNEIDFSVDRYIVDKSMTYNYNVNLAKPQWSEFPSAVPYPNPNDVYDMSVLFPRKTILPKTTE